MIGACWIVSGAIFLSATWGDYDKAGPHNGVDRRVRLIWMFLHNHDLGRAAKTEAAT